MSQDISAHGGVIEGLSRILRELLRTPRFRESARILLDGLDPGEAAALVKTLWSEDPELFLGLLSGLPSLASAAIEGGAELLRIIAYFPPELRESLAAGITAEFDAERLGEAAALLLRGVDLLASRLEEDVAREDSPVRLVTGMVAEGLKDVAGRNPGFMNGVVRPLLEAGREAMEIAEERAG